MAFGQDHHLVPRDVVFLDGFSDDLFRHAVAVHVGCIPGIKTSIIGCFEEGKGLTCQNSSFMVLERNTKGKGDLTYFFLLNRPSQGSFVTKTHRPKNGNRNPEATLSKTHIFSLAGVKGLLK